MAQPRVTDAKGVAAKVAASRTDKTRQRKPMPQDKKWIRVRQVRSGIGFKFNQRRVLAGLGLARPGRSVVLEDTASTRGMCKKIPHLVVFEEVSGPDGVTE